MIAARDPRLAGRVAAVLDAAAVDPAAAAALAEAMADAGIAAVCRQAAEEHAAAATSALDGIAIDARVRDALAAFAGEAVARRR